MIKGISITPPVVGRISIGRVVERNGKRLPEKDDQFTITSQIQTKEGWIPHPYDEGFRKAQGGKIRSIPVTVLFDDPALNFRAAYTMFDRQSGRPMCSGDGETCRRICSDGIKQMSCPTPTNCEMGQGGLCKPYGRLNVVIGDEDPTATFAYRTTGYNSIRTLTARLRQFQALSGDKLSCLPLELRLRGKSTTMSRGTPIYYVDLTLRTGLTMAEALQAASDIRVKREEAGFDQAALDEAARTGLANGEFEETEDEAGTVVDEFYPDDEVHSESEGTLRPTLADKLGSKLTRQNSTVTQEVAP